MPAEAEEEGFVPGWALLVGPALVVHNSNERAHGGAAFLQTVIEEVAAVDRLHFCWAARYARCEHASQKKTAFSPNWLLMSLSYLT